MLLASSYRFKNTSIWLLASVTIKRGCCIENKLWIPIATNCHSFVIMKLQFFLVGAFLIFDMSLNAVEQ